MTTTTLTETIVDAIASVRASDCERVDRNDDDDRGGWVNVTIEVQDGLTMRCGWWLHTSTNGLSADVADDVRSYGHAIAPYRGSDCDHDVSPELLARLAEEFECDEGDVYYELSRLWVDEADPMVADAVWLTDLQEQVERRVKDADVRELLKMLEADA
jgi:hypothetical protein